jgi:hypothetical protein
MQLLGHLHFFVFCYFIGVVLIQERLPPIAVYNTFNVHGLCIAHIIRIRTCVIGKVYFMLNVSTT